MLNTTHQVWNWSTHQRRHDFLMNKAYIFACSRLVKHAFKMNSTAQSILDVGAGSGLVLNFVNKFFVNQYQYTGIDLNSDGLEILIDRAQKLGCANNVTVKTDDITHKNDQFKNQFDMVTSNFCLYTIKSPQARLNAFKNIASYLKAGGSFHIALPSENYSAEGIALQCLKDELNDQQNIFIKALRTSILVPYQWNFILKPIAKKADQGDFVRFTLAQIKSEFEQAHLDIEEINLDYGGCGYHVHGKKP